MLRAPLLSVLLTAGTALAQTVLYVPDNNAAVGTCNAIPMSASFGSGSTTYVGRIPASFLDPANRTIRDIELAPCSTGTFSAPNVQIGMGHVPVPVPLPFTFPTFDAAGNMVSPGSFLDYSPLYNSVSQGPFTWTMTANTWSPMGLAAGSSGFTWNGVDDVAFYITYSGGTGGASCHRTTTEPFRIYASGTYQAGVSSGSGAAGLKMGLVATGFPVACGGCGSLSFGVSGSAAIGGTLTSTLGNLGGGLPFIGVGFAPYCIANFCPSCTIGHSWSVAIFGATSSLTIPNDASFIGLQLGFQGIGLLSPGGCQAPDLAFSATVGVTITQ